MAPEAEPVVFISCSSWNPDVPKAGVWDLEHSLLVEESWTADSAYMQRFSQAKWQVLRIIMSVRCFWDISTPSVTVIAGAEDA